MKIIHYPAISDLRKHILTKQPTLYVGSRTSTVIPYEMLLEASGVSISKDCVLGDLSSLPKQMNLDADGNLKISGAVSWKEAKEFCISNGLTIKTSPTEELALCLSGVATSATGERCFGHGTLRDQIVDVTYLSTNGSEITLDSKKNLIDHELFQTDENSSILKAYGETYKFYKKFKNAPFPRMEKQTDLMIGTEGQLGIIISANFKTAEKKKDMFLFIKLPKWEENLKPHLELFEKIQSFRSKVESCELVDENSIHFLPEEDRPSRNHDLIFLEILEENFEEVYSSLLSQLELINEDDMFEMNSSKCREFRMNIPRYIFEKNQKMGVTKVGTDVQVSPDSFEQLLTRYSMWKDEGVPYNLFGHFGDAHLHFNFMPKPNELDSCKSKLTEFYNDVKNMNGSPFAEHGIGLLKKPYIAPFYKQVHKDLFRILKNHFDPENILFPDGFMSLK